MERRRTFAATPESPCLRFSRIRDYRGWPDEEIGRITIFTEIIPAAQATHAIYSECKERYANLLANTSEFLWCLEFDEPVSLDLPEMEQVERLFRTRVRLRSFSARSRAVPLSDGTASECRSCFQS